MSRVPTGSRSRRLLVFAFAALGCAQGAPGGIFYYEGEDAVTLDGLHRVEWEPYPATYVRPGSDIRRYDRILIEEPTIRYRKPPKSARIGRTLVDPNYALTETERERMLELYRETFTRTLGASENFTIAEAPGPDVLRVVAHIVNLEITVPPDRDLSADNQIWASSMGRMSLIADASDSLTGESLVRVGQSRVIEAPSNGFRAVDAVSRTLALGEIFQSWAQQLRRGLDHLHALPRVPLAAAAESRPAGS